jgi:hypothetical protein
MQGGREAGWWAPAGWGARCMRWHACSMHPPQPTNRRQPSPASCVQGLTLEYRATHLLPAPSQRSDAQRSSVPRVRVLPTRHESLIARAGFFSGDGAVWVSSDAAVQLTARDGAHGTNGMLAASALTCHHVPPLTRMLNSREGDWRALASCESPLGRAGAPLTVLSPRVAIAPLSH